jgi:signal transduction histidine kinase
MNRNDEKQLRVLKEMIDKLIEGQRVSYPAENLPTEVSAEVLALRKSVLTLIDQYNECYGFVLDLSKGNLEVSAPARNNFATPFKHLQAELLHLIWQIQQVAEGDLEQKISFSGDFSRSFNIMISYLREKHFYEKQNELYVQELKELNVTKDRFFSIIAHDLKNPFYGMLGMSDILLEHIREKKTNDLEEYAYYLKKSAEQGYKLLLNLLDWSRIQTGKLQVNIVSLSLNQLLEEIIDLESSTALGKQIDMNLDCPRHVNVYADSNCLKTVVRNLVSNALKFTHPGGHVEISALVYEGYVEVLVSDNGVGMNKETLERLFRLDQNVSTPGTTSEGGTGLGLILCKEFLKKMNSDISVVSENGVGSIFRFRLKSVKG